MLKRAILAAASAAALAGCGQSEQSVTTSDLKTFDVAEAPPPEDAQFEPPERPAGAASPDAATGPQIAYTYSYSFRLPSERLAGVQERHLDLCNRLGPARCRVVDMRRGAASGDQVTGSLTLQVAAPVARQFGESLVAAAAEAGGDTVDRGITAEDLSKNMVDAAARIRTREALVQRLTQLLETRSGNIQQAVEAERAINQAQEELEAARGWLAEMRTRVAMSTFTIGYNSGAPLAGSVGNPVREAFGEIGTLFGRSLALMIYLVGALLPWALLLALILLLVRTLRRRGWWLRREEEPEPNPAP